MLTFKGPVASTRAPQSAITDYLANIGKIAILSKDQQLHHGRNIREWLDWPDGKDAAPVSVQRKGRRSFDRMVESNLRIVVSIAKKYSGNGVSLEDLIQEGNLGLMVAAEKFEPVRGYCFSTCAYWWIRQSMTRALANSSRTIRVPCNVTERIRRIRNTQDRWMQEHGTTPTIEQLAEASGEELEKVKQAIEVFAMQPRSLDELLADDVGTLEDIVGGDPLSMSEWREQEASEDRLRAFHDLLEELPEEQRRIVEAFVFDQMTQDEIGAELGMARQRVSHLYRMAKKRLQALARQSGLAAPVTDLTTGPVRSKVNTVTNRAKPFNRTSKTKSYERYENTLIGA